MRAGAPIGLGGLALLLLLSVVFGENFFTLLDPGAMSGGGSSMGTGAATEDFRTTPEEEEMVDFISFVRRRSL